MSNNQNINNSIDTAIELIRDGKYLPARSILKSILNHSSDYENAWLWFAETYSDVEEKRQVLQIYLDKFPDSPRAEQVREYMQASAPEHETSSPTPQQEIEPQTEKVSSDEADNILENEEALIKTAQVISESLQTPALEILSERMAGQDQSQHKETSAEEEQIPGMPDIFNDDPKPEEEQTFVEELVNDLFNEENPPVERENNPEPEAVREDIPEIEQSWKNLAEEKPAMENVRPHLEEPVLDESVINEWGAIFAPPIEDKRTEARKKTETQRKNGEDPEQTMQERSDDTEPEAESNEKPRSSLDPLPDVSEYPESADFNLDEAPLTIEDILKEEIIATVDDEEDENAQSWISDEVLQQEISLGENQVFLNDEPETEEPPAEEETNTSQPEIISQPVIETPKTESESAEPIPAILEKQDQPAAVSSPVETSHLTRAQRKRAERKNAQQTQGNKNQNSERMILTISMLIIFLTIMVAIIWTLTRW